MNYIAVDWGTSNFRAMRVKNGTVIRTVSADCGVGRCEKAALPGLLRQQLARMEDDYTTDLPVLMCGMIGSNIGIIDAGYLDLPLPFNALFSKGIPLDGILPNPLTLRPGICDRRVNEVCRGEEMQLAGALTLNNDTVFAAVGTHSKWLTVDRQRQQVDSLRTLMTGELYHLLLNHSVVGKGLPEQQISESVFLGGVETAQRIHSQEDDLVTELFRCRGRYVLGAMPPEYAASWLSGLLIGNEILRGHPVVQSVCFIGAPVLLAHYLRACDALKLPCTTLTAETAIIAGLNGVFNYGSS